jgi:uncharacterized membrane protein
MLRLMDIGVLLAAWLHTVAFVIAWGYYGIAGRFMIPGLRDGLTGEQQVNVLAGVERRALPFVLISLVLFTVTGTYLLFVAPEYQGLGNFFASTWTTLMLIKHVVILALVAAAVSYSMFVRRSTRADDDEARTRYVRYARFSAEAATALGAIVALLTVAAQQSV